MTSFNQQILFAVSNYNLDLAFVKSLIAKGMDINMELFDGRGELGKDIMYFVLKEGGKDFVNILDMVEKLLNVGFIFNNQCAYWFLFLEALDMHRQTLSPALKKRIMKTLVRMIQCGMNICDVAVYYDDRPKTGNNALLIHVPTSEYSAVKLSSCIFQIGITFHNLFSQQDLYYDQEIQCEGTATKNVEWLCRLKDKFCIPLYDETGKQFGFKICNPANCTFGSTHFDSTWSFK